ncbi:DUF2249 domain-containing protein (plasmid) [Halorussus limi]|uniref:DUF2249 domain-containing protein n=1 Tax=Halorussus limi TaxID=2938695 RepID=A0A8U0I1H6_9EURY|nr:DUF2249 domain-containing protein [Halorussus limi]UPV77215.1 DUF2249 domain-containing protein [Halorussus limi]
MVSEIDVRERTADECREQIREDLRDIPTGETVTIVAHHDVEAALYQYQIKRGETLDWQYENAGPEVWEIRVSKSERAGGGTALTEFDVREMPPRKRHSVLLETFELLDPEEGFVLVNDHDPKPLYHELRSTRGDIFEWEYTNRDSQEWTVEIRKTDEGEVEDDDEVQAKFDVREIPKQERHPTIHHRYGNLEDGNAMEITAPHEPRPLHREFRQRYGQSFSWEVRDKEPGRCRVRITKGGQSSTDDEAPSQSTDESMDVTEELDVRDLPPAQRHQQIFEAYEQLQSGEAFVLVNDHDPKPLYHQFEAETGSEFRWEYRQQEPGEFRVLIGKADVIENDSSTSETTKAPF